MEFNEPGVLQVGVSLVELGDGGHEQGHAVAAAGQQDAVGVDAQLEGVADLGAALELARTLVVPAAVLADEVAAPADEAEVELEALGLELGGGDLELAAGLGVAAVLREPGADLHAPLVFPLVLDSERG